MRDFSSFYTFFHASNRHTTWNVLTFGYLFQHISITAPLVKKILCTDLYSKGRVHSRTELRRAAKKYAPPSTRGILI